MTGNEIQLETGTRCFCFRSQAHEEKPKVKIFSEGFTYEVLNNKGEVLLLGDDGNEYNFANNKSNFERGFVTLTA